MALTATPVTENPSGGTLSPGGSNLRMVVVNCVGDASYPTGGYALPVATLGMPNSVLFAQGELIASTGATNAASVAYNVATNKLQYFQSTGAEVTNATNVSAGTWQLIAWGF